MRCLRILIINSQDRVANKTVLEQAGIPSMFALLTEGRLRWLGHFRRMNDDRIPKDMLFGELATGSRPAGRPFLCYKDVCKRDLKAGNINPTGWETVAADPGGLLLKQALRCERGGEKPSGKRESCLPFQNRPQQPQ